MTKKQDKQSRTATQSFTTFGGMTAAPDKSADGPNPGSRKPKKDGMEVHMRGSVVGQIQALYKISGVICIGMKRHNAKAFARAAGARTSQEIAAQCPITSYATADKYRGIAILFGHYTKTNFRRWDVEATSADDIRDYLGFVINSAVALRTFRTYAAGLNKLAVALNMYATKFNSGRNYDFTAAINELRVIARLLKIIISSELNFVALFRATASYHGMVLNVLSATALLITNPR